MIMNGATTSGAMQKREAVDELAQPPMFGASVLALQGLAGINLPWRNGLREVSSHRRWSDLRHASGSTMTVRGESPAPGRGRNVRAGRGHDPAAPSRDRYPNSASATSR